MDASRKKAQVTLALKEMALGTVSFLEILVHARHAYTRRRNNKQTNRSAKYDIISKIPARVSNLQRIINISDVDCIENLKMSRNAFLRLCYLLEHSGGITDTRNVRVHEKVAIFLTVLGHHRRNRTVKEDFVRSGYTVSKYFHEVLETLLKLYPLLISTPEPVPEDCTVEEWKWFKGCLGALDCTYINVKVPESEKAQYRTRKGDIAVNVLGVCNRDMKFVYLLPGWEGSAANDKVLLDALSRNNGSLKVPNGHYYLCDNAYTNGNGFLTPYRDVRYHLQEWGDTSSPPQNKEEFFNLKHSCARNVIQKTFRLLKMRWAVLRSNSHYSIKVQNRVIMACALLHNFIRNEMPVDPLEQNLEENLNSTEGEHMDFINADESEVWSSWRDDLANSMFNEWLGVE